MEFNSFSGNSILFMLGSLYKGALPEVNQGKYSGNRAG